MAFLLVIFRGRMAHFSMFVVLSADEGKSLPEPSIQNLKEILLMITTVNAILRDRYVRTLLDKVGQKS